VSAGATRAQEPTLSYEEIVRRALPASAELTRRAELAVLERELGSTGRFTREAPTLDAEAGPRKTADGATVLEASAHIEFPLLTGGRALGAAENRLRESGPEMIAAETVEARLLLRTAFLDAWMEQERIAVIDAQLASTRQVLAAVRKRVEDGADAPYEAALVEGDLLRLESDRDEAEAARGDAWARVRALSEVPASPPTLDAPGLPVLAIPQDADERFEAGVLRRALAHRGSMASAFVDLDQARRRSRWSVAGTVAKEGDEGYATIGAGYRFPRSGEKQAAAREREAVVAAIGRDASVESSRLATRFATVRDRAQRFGPVSSPGAFDEALAAIALRMELGKERPSQALPVRRQILDTQAAALRRVRDAHVLIAELDALTAGDAP